MPGLPEIFKDSAADEFLVATGRLSERFSGCNVDGTTNIVPTMDLGVLRDRYAELLGTLYSPRLYYRRIRVFLRAYRMPRLEIRWDLGYQLQQWRAFLLAAVRLGIAGKERFEFWKLLLWTAFRRPRAFSLAVTFAIYGYHFRRTCEARLN